MRILNLLFLLISNTIIILTINAQDTLNKKCDYAKDPCWINMMNDPKVNYFEALKAFDEFWKARGGEPFYSENADERTKYNQQKRSSKERKQEEEKQKFLIDYKKFLNWKRQVEPYVQSDGSILSPQDQQKLNENQR